MASKYINPIPIKKLKTSEKAYMAGIIDGEGYLGLSRNGRSDGTQFWKARVIIANCNLELLKYLQSIFGGKIVTDEHRDKPLWSTGYKLQLAYFEEWLPQVMPYMMGKKKKAKLFLEARNLLRLRNKNGKGSRTKRIIEINDLLRKKEWLL